MNDVHSALESASSGFCSKYCTAQKVPTNKWSLECKDALTRKSIPFKKAAILIIVNRVVNG